VTTGGMEGKLISYGTCKRSQGWIYMIYKPLKMIWLLRRFGLDSTEEMFGEKVLENINLEEIKVLDQC